MPKPPSNSIISPRGRRPSSSSSSPRRHRHSRPATLSFAEQQQIQDAFQLFDTEHRGVIDPNDLIRVVESLENMPDHMKETIEEYIELLQQQNELLSLQAFTDLLTYHRYQSAEGSTDPHDLRRIFDLFDENKKGYLTVSDLERVARELGESMTMAELQEMIERADSSGDGKVSREDFYAIMTQQLFS